MSENNSSLRPNLPKRLFWEWIYDEIDWQEGASSIIERVLEWGTPADKTELIRYYGEPRIIKALKEEITYLPDFLEEEVSQLFKLRKEELKCYAWKQSRRGHWI